MRWLAIVGSLVAVACAGPQGDPGTPCTVTANSDGTKTLACPDGTNVTITDGTAGQPGPQGDAGIAGSSCTTQQMDGGVLVQCTDGTNAFVPAGSQGKVGINGVTGKFGLVIESVVSTSTLSTLTFAVYPAANVCPGGVCNDGLTSAVVGTKTFYATEYNATTNTFDTARTFSFNVIHFQGFTEDGNGARYAATRANPSFMPESSTSALVYAYVTGKAAAPAPSTGHYLLPDSVASDVMVFGTIAYQSNANVAGCERCHGAPYAKHGYRMADVPGAPSFAPCKVCHTDQRAGGHADWYMTADDPAIYASTLAANNGTLPAAYKAKYAYTANLMNDVHNSHGFEFNYPQRMSNCTTCHEGKLANILTDSNFKPTVCKSCHVVNGPTPGVGNGGVEGWRAPAMTAIWADKGVSLLHTMDLYGSTDGGVDVNPAECNTCHKAGGSGKTFAQIHSGRDPMIFDSTGTKYADTITTSIDSTTYNSSTNVLTVDFSVSGANANAVVFPTLVGALYGWDTKDFVESGHSTIAGQRALEYTEGASNNSPRLTVSPAVATAGNTTWTATVDLSYWAAALPDGGAGLLASGVVKRMQLSVLPGLGEDQTVRSGETSRGSGVGYLADGGINQMIAITGATATVTLVDKGTLVAGDVDPNGYGQDIVAKEKCNSCHDRLATTFHNPNYGSAGTPACRSCHWVGAAGSHLEMQSRSIDSYVHAIHRMQKFDPGDIDFQDPVELLRYEEHIAGNYPNFAGPLNCESCHNPGKYNIPDQTRSLPSIISGSDNITTWARNIGTYPRQITGPAERACGGCHRAVLINEDDASGLAAFYAHTTVNGSSVMDTSNWSLDATNRYIMGQIGVDAPSPYVMGAQVESCDICHKGQGDKHQQLFNSWKNGLE